MTMISVLEQQRYAEMALSMQKISANPASWSCRRPYLALLTDVGTDKQLLATCPLLQLLNWQVAVEAGQYSMSAATASTADACGSPDHRPRVLCWGHSLAAA